MFLAHGTKPFGGQTTFFVSKGSRPTSIVVGHFNNDNITDIVVASSDANNIGVLIGFGDRNFSTLMTYSMGNASQPVLVAIGDFNRDYQLDIAVANFRSNNVCIIFDFGNGSFTNQTCYSLGYNSRSNWIIFKDLNNDRWEDIAVTNYGIDNIKILFNLC